MAYKGRCPGCRRNQEKDWIPRTEHVTECRGIKIDIHVPFVECPSCGFEFDDPTSDVDVMQMRYEAAGITQDERVVSGR